jgi:VanZ family protein
MLPTLPPAVLRALWPLALAALIVGASARPAIAGPKVENFDKVAHFSVYGLLGTLACRVGRGPRAAVLGLVAVSAFGATDEWHQSFVPGRSPSVADWVADTLGATTAILLYVKWGAYRRLLETPLGPRPKQA